MICAMLRRSMQEIAPRLAQIAVVCGGNIVIRSVARFLAFSMGLRTSFHDTEQEALEEARRVLRGA